MFILLLVLVQPLKLILLQRKNYWKHWKSKRKTNPDGKRKTNPDVLVETSREVAVTILALLLHLRIWNVWDVSDLIWMFDKTGIFSSIHYSLFSSNSSSFGTTVQKLKNAPVKIRVLQINLCVQNFNVCLCYIIETCLNAKKFSSPE